jgi:hypothetical protein
LAHFRFAPPSALCGITGLNAIPWLANLEELSGAELSFLVLMVAVACLVVGFVLDVIIRDLGLGPLPNGVFALVGACAGIYLRYRLLAPYRADDVFLTIGFALGTVFLLFLLLGVAKSRVL